MSSLNNTTLYVGVTSDINRRVQEHKSGQIPGFTQNTTVLNWFITKCVPT